MPQEFDTPPASESSPAETMRPEANSVQSAADGAPATDNRTDTAAATADLSGAAAATDEHTDTASATAERTSAADIAETTPESTPECPATESFATAESPDSAASAEPGTAPPTPAGPRVLQVGERVRGRIVAIDDEITQVDFGGTAPARIRSAELRDRSGTMLLRVDDRFTASVTACDEFVLLSLGKKRGVLDAARMREALEKRTTVNGTVQTVNKGGFEIRIGRVRGFCPLSQMDTGFVDNPESFVGKTFSFRVLRWENHGRNIVLSRRSVLREEAKTQAQELRKQLVEGAELEGTVKRLQPFGAFVDLGGLEGLLHVSRMSHSRVDDPATIVAVGGTVRVRVVKVEHPGTRRERIALALADLGPDPWANVQEQLHIGDMLTGTIVRLAPFGAFVRLPMGLDGLVHLSELSHQRINEPSEVVNPGQEVQVRVLHIDLDKRRVSLSLRRSAETSQPAPRKREPRRERAAPPREPRPSPTSGGVSLTHTMAEQLGSLKAKLRGHA